MMSNAEFERRGVEIVTGEGIEMDDVLVLTSGGTMAICELVVVDVVNEYAEEGRVELGLRHAGSRQLRYVTVDGDTLFVRVRREDG